MAVQVVSVGLTVNVSALNVNRNGIQIRMSGISIACSFTGDPIYIQCIQLCTFNTTIIDVVEAHCYLVDTRAN